MLILKDGLILIFKANHEFLSSLDIVPFRRKIEDLKRIDCWIELIIKLHQLHEFMHQIFLELFLKHYVVGLLVPEQPFNIVELTLEIFVGYLLIAIIWILRLIETITEHHIATKVHGLVDRILLSSNSLFNLRSAVATRKLMIEIMRSINLFLIIYLTVLLTRL